MWHKNVLLCFKVSVGRWICLRVAIHVNNDNDERRQALSWIIGWALKHCKLPPRRLTYYTTNHVGRRVRGPRRQSGGTQRPTAVAVYIIISSYDYFAFCLPTGARRGQSSKAYLLFSVKATRPHRLGDLFQAVAPKVDGEGPFSQP
jgi:hypothetical protein